MPRWTTRSLLALAALAVALIGAEVAYRWMLFGGHPAFAHLRRPDLHADFLSEDAYWILYQRWGGRYGPPGAPHPTLGWVSPAFDRETLRHDGADAVGDRRPVLLYGDSYTWGVPGVPALDALLNDDAAFAAGHHALNYGVGGYGIDQVMLLQAGSARHHADPLVVVGVMPLDLDRAALCVRVGQKPCFDARLRPRGAPVAPDAAAWFAAADPGIRSYVWRKLLFASFTPPRLRDGLRGAGRTERHKAAVATAVLTRLRDQLADTPHLWLVWDTHYPSVGRTLGENDDWRDRTIRAVLQDDDAIWGRDAIAAELAGAPLVPADWIRPEDGHPSRRLNEAMAGRVRAWTLTPENPGAWQPERVP